MTQLMLINKGIEQNVYNAALEFVQLVDINLEAGLHYRDTEGASLTTLDQVVAAVESDRWPTTEVAYQHAA